MRGGLGVYVLKMEAKAAGDRANANNCPVNIKKIHSTPTEGRNSAPVSLVLSLLKGNLAFHKRR